MASLLPYAQGAIHSGIDYGLRTAMNRLTGKKKTLKVPARAPMAVAKDPHSGIATKQHDFVVTKRKRRLNRRLKRKFRRARRFRQSVMKAIYGEGNPQFYSFKENGLISSSAGGIAIKGCGTLFSCHGDSQNKDMKNILDDMGPYILGYTGGGTGTKVMSDAAYSKTIFQNAYMQVDIKNVATTDCIVDVYEYVVRKTMSDQANVNSSLVTANGFWSNVSGSANATNTTSGMTPYHCPDFTAECKIIGKVTYNMAAGSNITFKKNVNKTRSVENRVLLDASDGLQWGLKGWTTGYVLVLRGVPNISDGAEIAAAVTYNAVKVYSTQMPVNMITQTTTKI